MLEREDLIYLIQQLYTELIMNGYACEVIEARFPGIQEVIESKNA